MKTQCFLHERDRKRISLKHITPKARKAKEKSKLNWTSKVHTSKQKLTWYPIA